MERTKILFLDSGVGGLTLLNKAIRRFPRENYIFYTDSANMPYGDQSKEEVLACIRKNLKAIESHSLKAIVVSCHTINTIALEELRSHFDIPVIGVGEATKSRNKDFDPRKFLLIGTPLTIQNISPNRTIKGLQTQDLIDMLPFQELVDFAEEFDFDSPTLRRYLKASLSAINWDDYHTLVIACSHIMFYKRHIRDLIPSTVDIIDSQSNCLDQLGSLLSQDKAVSEYNLQCFLSGIEVANEAIAPYLNYLNARGFF